MKSRIPFLILLFLSAIHLNAQTRQATPPPTQPFGTEAFGKTDNTVIRWLGNAGFFVNTRGTTLMIDPLLKGFDMPLLIDMPIRPEDVPHLDAVLITHVDNDHYSVPTNRVLSPVTKEFHSTRYVASLMKEQGFNAFGHDIGEEFTVGNVHIKLTPADHAWQNMMPDRTREYKMEDYCGFWMQTPDGIIWAPGDSRMLDDFLTMPVPDAIFFDFSDSGWHLGFDNAVKVANAYPDTPLLLSHWGTVDAPDMSEFNADPEQLKKEIVNPGRVYVLAPGEAFTLKALQQAMD